jgi:peptidoglycan-associated lipoprotein
LKQLMLFALILFLSLGCSTRDKGNLADPIKQTQDQPFDPIPDQDGTAMMDGSGSDSLLAEGNLNPVFFDYDSFDIGEAQRIVLQSNAEVAKGQSLPLIRIEGHCDERGTEEYNLALGDRRASAAKEYLISLGLDPGKLQTLSFGESRPFEKEHDEAAWSFNRRAHFVVE